MKRFVRVCLLLSVAITAGCSRSHRSAHIIVASPGHSLTEFLQGVEQFPYDVGQARKQLVVQACGDLERMMREEQVRGILGKPDEVSMTYEMLPDGSEGRLQGASWGYYLHREARALPNSALDETIHLMFDDKGSLVWVYVLNVDVDLQDELALIIETPSGSPVQ